MSERSTELRRAISGRMLLFFIVGDVLRRDPVGHEHFRAPTILPLIGALVSLALMTTKDGDIFLRAGALLVIGAILWLVTWYAHGRHQPSMDTSVLQAVKRPD